MSKSKNRPIQYMNLPYHLKLLRELNKLDVGYIAKHCKTTKQKVWAWENGLSEPTIFQLECLTVLYDTSMDLLCGTFKSSKIIANQAIVDKEVTVEELMLIRIFRELSPTSQSFVKQLIEKSFLDEKKKSEQMYADLDEVLNSQNYETFIAFLEKYKSSN